MFFIKVFLTFIFYSFLGYIFEVRVTSLETKKYVNRGYLNGPIIPIYGVGTTAILFLLKSFKNNFILLCFLVSLICIITEYITGILIDKFFNIKLWDYTNRKFNLHGKICLETSLLFIVCALLVVYIINPLFISILSKLSFSEILLIYILTTITFLIDMFFSSYILIIFTKNRKSLNKDDDITNELRIFTKKYIDS